MDKPDYPHHFLEGLDRFNGRRFWDAHESWETIWLAAESDVEQFLQGLIQLAAGYHHIQRGTLRGAPRLFEAALRRLSAFPAGFSGLDRASAEDAARRHQVWAATLVERDEGGSLADGELPSMTLLAERETFSAPRQDW
jgi:predicted metal-dependent hydrolase